MGYVADDPEDPDAGRGLFNGDYAASAQLTYTSAFVDVGLLYANSYATSADGEFSQRIYDLEDRPATANTYGLQTNFKLTDTLELGGGVAFTNFQQDGAGEDFNMWSYQGTLAVRDVLGEGNLLGLLVGIPSYTRDLEGQTDDTALLGEIFYRYYINDNIHITPSVIVNTDPLNDNDNDASVIGSLRTTFKF